MHFFTYNSRWLRHLNEYGVCLLTDVPTELGQLRKVIGNETIVQAHCQLKEPDTSFFHQRKLS